jgi:stage II sporulation protein M
MKFKKNLRESAKYLRQSWNYILAIALIFAVGIAIGFMFFQQFGFLDGILKELVGKMEGLDLWGTIIFIFQNNAWAAFLGLFLGLVLGVFPVINAISNGVIIGYVLRNVWIDSGISEMWKILPHGIFELPAIVISLGLGVKLGMFVFSKNRRKELVRRLKNSLFIFLFLILPLLIAAAFIEGLLISLYK